MNSHGKVRIQTQGLSAMIGGRFPFDYISCLFLYTSITHFKLLCSFRLFAVGISICPLSLQGLSEPENITKSYCQALYVYLSGHHYMGFNIRNNVDVLPG